MVHQSNHKQMETTSSKKFKSVDEYLASLPATTRVLLQELRSRIQKTAPEAEELISYNIPAFKLNGILVWYAGFKNHIGFYPKTSAMQAFKEELSAYKGAKGSVQFPLDRPLPLSLVSKMVKYRIKENEIESLEKVARKKK